eukprot:2500450-Rhodomonas_salina.2
MARQELAWDLPGNDPLSCGNDGCGASGAEYARRPKQSLLLATRTPVISELVASFWLLEWWCFPSRTLERTSVGANAYREHDEQR